MNGLFEMVVERLSRSKYEEMIKEAFQPDADGVSDWVEVIDLVKLGFKWTKNGNTRRGAPWGDKVYEWEFRRRGHSNKSEILAMRTTGFSSKNHVSSSIRQDIQKEIIESKYCNFSLLPIPIVDREVDHRYGYKEHEKYRAINDPTTQRIEHFQLLHHAQNVQKRQMCKECVETSVRPAHPFREFIEGTAQLDDITVCNGCYLAEPERYR